MWEFHPVLVMIKKGNSYSSTESSLNYQPFIAYITQTYILKHLGCIKMHREVWLTVERCVHIGLDAGNPEAKQWDGSKLMFNSYL